MASPLRRILDWLAPSRPPRPASRTLHRQVLAGGPLRRVRHFVGVASGGAHIVAGGADGVFEVLDGATYASLGRIRTFAEVEPHRGRGTDPYAAPAPVARDARQPFAFHAAVARDAPVLVVGLERYEEREARSRVVEAWDVATGRRLGATADPGWGRVAEVAALPDGKRAAAVFDCGERGAGPAWSDAPAVAVIDLATFERRPLAGHGAITRREDVHEGGPFGFTRDVEVEAAVHRVAAAPDGTRIATAGEDGTIRLWETASGREVLRVTGGGRGPLAFAPGGARLAWGASNAVLVRDIGPGEAGTTAAPRAEPGSAPALRIATGAGLGPLAFHPDGSVIAAAEGDGAIAIRDARTGEERARLAGRRRPAGERCPVHAIAFLPDGGRLATIDETGELVISRVPAEAC